MNILHLQPKLNLTCGISKTIYLICKNSNDSCNHYVYTMGGDAINKFNNAGINLIVSDQVNKGLFQSVPIFFDILKIVRREKIEIIHSHHRYFDLVAFLISKVCSVETVTSVQSRVYGRKLLSYKVKNFIACGNSIKQHLIDYFGIKSELIKVIYNFVDPSEVRKNLEGFTLRKELEIDEEEIVIGFVGRFNKLEKGIDVLLETFKKLKSENRKLILLLIGGGEDKELIVNFINKEKIKAKVLIPMENIYDVYNVIDIVVLPSKVDPFPLVMLECGLMKKAFIGSNVDGIKEFIENGKNGILVESGNIDSLTSGLKTLIEDPHLRQTLGQELYTKVMNNFTSEKIIPLYEQTYLEVLSKHN
jgi:glycosyltransferase involved in cell wall biosynthesis